MKIRNGRIVAALAVLTGMSAWGETVSSTKDLRSLLRESQKRLCIPSIPSTNILWDSQGENEDVFVDWSGFKPPEKKNAIAILDHNLIPRYEILLWESPETGLITIANAYGESIATLRPEKGFEPLG